MLTQYTYIKPRHQFGRQCIFTTTKYVAEENIWPDPALTDTYILRTHCHVYTQVLKQYAVHEVQTKRKLLTNSGVLHSEGSWPKEINSKDAEAVQRFRRRVEKSDNWAYCLPKLLKTMETFVHQNSAVNIHQNYFDDLIATSMAKQYTIRVVNVYEDPQTKVRPIRQVSWSSSDTNRLAAAYGFLEFEKHLPDFSPYSYVWDIENPNTALYKLKPPCPMMSIEFNIRDPVMLVSGLLSGQVCCWDLRISNKPVAITHVYHSHRHPVTKALWIPSKSNTDLFSCSTDGIVLWWDMRFMGRPTDSLVIDLENPSRANLLEAVGITALQYEPTMSSKFLAGTENGIVLNVNRRGNNPMEKLAQRFDCYAAGSVLSLDRNPMYTKNFLTVGNWCAQVWGDDTKEGFFLSACSKSDLNGGCWNRSRYSVFFTISNDGMVHAYDLLAGVKTPLTSIRVCSNGLTAINSHEDGKLLAAGSCTGNIYLLECSQDLTAFTKDERLALSNYFDKCSRYEKAIDNRLKEIRLASASGFDFPTVRIEESKTKSKKKDQKEKKKEKEKSAGKERRGSSKKLKNQRPKGKSAVKASAHLMEVEMNYFRKIEEESAKFIPLDETDMESAETILAERVMKAPLQERKDGDKDDLKKTRSIRQLKSRSRIIRAAQNSVDDLSKALSEEIDTASIKERDTIESPPKVLKKSCAKKVCKPKICCRDMEEKQRSRLTKKLIGDEMSKEGVPEKSRSFVVENKWFRTLSDYVALIPPPPRTFQRKIMALRSAPPNILRGELEEAKKEIRVWQEKAIAKRLSTWDIERKLQPQKLIEISRKPPEETKHMVSEMEITDRYISPRTDMMTSSSRIIGSGLKGSRSRRKVRLTSEEVKRIEEEKQKELWNVLKKKVMQYDDYNKLKQYYPRISAAFVQTPIDDESEETKQ